MKRVATVMLLTCWVAPASAQPDGAQADGAQLDETKRSCLEAYEKSQELRLDKRLVEARTQLSICASASCPEVASADCRVWLNEVEAALPTVVLRVENATGAVTVTIDGRTHERALDGPISVDPGLHVFTFQVPGRDPIVIRKTIEAGQKDQPIIATFPEPPPAVPSPGPVAPPSPVQPSPAPSAPAASGSVHPVAWALYGVAALGVGGFIGFGVHSLAQEDCEPACTDDEVDDVVMFRALADVSLGVGVLALGGAIWATVASLDADETAVRVTPHGVAIRF